MYFIKAEVVLLPNSLYLKVKFTLFEFLLSVLIFHSRGACSQRLVGRDFDK